MAEELKPCPFCGSEDIYSGENDLYCKNYIVYCYQCGCGTSADDETPEAAVKAWNRRAERTCTFSRCLDDEDPLPTCSTCGYEADVSEVLVKPGGEFIYEYGWCVGCGAKVRRSDD